MKNISPPRSGDAPDAPDNLDLKKRLLELFAKRSTGGLTKGDLTEESPLAFEYADMWVKAHLRSHYDGVMIREGGALLLVMRALITLIPDDAKVLRCALENSSRYPNTSVCLIPAKVGPGIAGRLEVYSTLVAPTLTPDELDLALRSMLQHYHHLPLELGAINVDPSRRHLLQEKSQSRQVGKIRVINTAANEKVANKPKKSVEPKIDKTESLTNTEIDEKSLNLAFGELDKLVGLAAVKDELKGLATLAKFNLGLAKDGLKTSAYAPHLVFVGNPGTCKTTVASHVAKIYHALGIVMRPQVEVVTRADLVAGYIGQTAIRTRAVCNRALGGVLFIDEAYSLTEEKDGFGHEVIETLLTQIEEQRGELVVIIAGYPEKMQRFIDSNPGLRSRFDRTIEFPDYTNDELVEIYVNLARERNFGVTPDALVALAEKVGGMQRGPSFGNGREVRKWLDAAVTKHAMAWQESGEDPDFERTVLSRQSVIAGFNDLVSMNTPNNQPFGYL